MKSYRKVVVYCIFAKILWLFAAGYPAQAQRITEFRFNAEAVGWNVDLVGGINHQNQTITVTTQRWIDNIASLRATFTLDGNYEVRVGETVQQSGATQNDFRRDVVYTIDDVDYTVRFVSPQASGLPVIRIDTENGAAINSRDVYTNMTSFILNDPNDAENDISEIGIADDRGRYNEIRGRGNSTWWGPAKKPYRVRFRNDVPFFGLPPARNWVLLANYYDPTLIKNSFVFELGDRLGVPYTPSYNHVELYLNGIYQGSYMFTEHRQADPNERGAPGRVKIDLTEGWLVEFDFRYHETDDPKFRTTSYSLPIVVKSPDEGNNMTNPVYNIVRDDWNMFSDLLLSTEFPENGYREMIDMNSFINYFLIQIIAQNTDFYIGLDGRQEPGSIFIHRKDQDSEIAAGPLWDFDLSFGVGSGLNLNTFNIRPFPTYPFFNRFFQDPLFFAKWKENWNCHFEEISSMSSFIDELAEIVRSSAAENNKLWRANDNYAHRISELKTYFEARLAFLNTVYNRIEVLPATSRNFGATTYNSELPPQTFTLVSYGEMSDLTAEFKNENSTFEISTGLTQTPTGNGGYIATVSVKPKKSAPGGVHNEVLVLSGKNQGNDFSQDISLTFAVDVDANLKSLTVSEGRLSPDFVPFITSYTLNVPNEVSEITITAEANHTDATVTTGELNNHELNEGANTITVTVTAEDGVTTRTYTVTVNRATLTSATETLVHDDLNIYPNPFKDLVGFQNLQGLVQIQIINSAGATVHTQIIENNDKTISVKHLPPGVYLFRFENNGKIRTVRGVKE